MEKSYISTPMDRTFLYETLHERLKLFTKQSPNKPAFVFYTMGGDRSTITYLELYEQSILFANGLCKLGIQRDDVIASNLPNSREWLICHFGILLAGAVTLGFSFNRSDGEDFKYFILKAGTCRAVILNCDSEADYETIKLFATKTNVKGEILESKIKGLKYIINSGRIRQDFPFRIDDVLLLGQTFNQVVLPQIHPDDVCIIMLTSGTTGFPKLASWTHFGVLSFYCSNGGVMDVKRNDVYFNMMPFRGVAGYAFQFLSVGCLWVTIDDLSKARAVRSLTDTIVDIINDEKCNYALIEGPCLYDMISDSVDLKSQFPIDTIFAGGYPMRSSIANIIGQVARRLIYNYGSTEMGFYSAKEVTYANEFQDFNCGSPFPDFEMRVVDEHDRICQRGETGTIHTRSRIPFRGYINDKNSTANALVYGGWFNTQDRGYITTEGEVIVLGRQNETIHVGSLNVSPIGIEQLIAKHPEVQDVKIVPVPDEFTFQQLCACIVRKENSVISWQEIKEFLLRLSYSDGNGFITSEIPRYHIFFEMLPVAINGKLKRNDLVEHCLKRLQLK